MLRAARHGENLIRLLRKALELGAEASERLVESEKLLAIFFEKRNQAFADGQLCDRGLHVQLGIGAERLRGRTLDSARGEILSELEGERAELDSLTAKIVAEGLATLSTQSGMARDLFQSINVMFSGRRGTLATATIGACAEAFMSA